MTGALEKILHKPVDLEEDAQVLPSDIKVFIKIEF